MLKKRSRAVSSSKQNLPSPTGKYNKMTSSSIFPSPRLFVGFSSKGFSDTEPAAMSPTSILETKPCSSIGNPFFTDRNTRKPLHETTVPLESKHHPWDNGDSKAIGLGIIDALTNEKLNDKSSKQDSRMVLFGSQLKIQIPSIHSNSISPTGSVESPHSPIEFGIKTKDSQLALYSPSPFGSATPSRVFSSACFSPRDMELSEDYTCVISHGPNPKTTHIFDNCIVESCGDGFIPLKTDHAGYPSDDFLSFCYACKKNLGQGKDIFMYGGEKAFCSRECRSQEMLFDEEESEKHLMERPSPL